MNERSKSAHQAQRPSSDEAMAETALQNRNDPSWERANASGSADDAAWIGREIDGRYRISEKLGMGGMGAVFVAEHITLRKLVALKVIHPEFAGDGEMAARFAREAMASARLEHPHVASALDFGTLPEGGAYLVMQLVRGRSLREMLETGGAMPWTKACEIGAQVADALEAAHAAGIIHRDLKPDNILLEPRDDGSELVKVLDFGVARLTSDDHRDGAAQNQKGLTRVGTVIGTPGYMAPEQAMGDNVDHRVDLYALGVVIWETIAGRPLFTVDDLTHIVTLQLTETPPSIRETSADATIPMALEGLIARLLARRPDDRPARAAQVRDELRRFALAASSIQHSKEQSLSFEKTGSAWAVPRTSDVAQQPSGISRARVRPHVPTALAALGCASLLAIAAGGVVLAMSLVRDQPKEAPVVAVPSPPNTPSTEPEAGGNVATKIVDLLRPTKRNREDALPEEVRVQMQLLTDSKERRVRREAAEWLLHYEPSQRVPTYARAIARFENARTCRARKEAIQALVELGDQRALPTLERVQESPRRGCGFLSLGDCHSCIRTDVAAAIATLRPTPQP